MPRQSKSLKFNAILNVLRVMVSLIFPLITFPYSSRILLPEGIGKVNFANSIVAFFSVITALGIPTYGVREAAKLRDNKLLLSIFVKEMLSINFISCFISYIFLIVLILFTPKLQSYKILILVCSSTLFFNVLGMEWLFLALEDLTYITIRIIIFQFISLFSLFIFVKTKDDYLKYALIAVFASGGSNVLNFIYSHKIISFKVNCKINLTQHIRPLFYLFSFSIATQVYSVLDTTMLGFLTDDSQVGYYAAATKINRMIIAMISALTSVIIPRLSYYNRKNDKTELNNLFFKTLKVIFLLVFPCAFGLSLISKNVIILLSGVDFLSAIPLMRILNILVILVGISTLLGQYLIVINKENISLYAVCIAAFVNFTLNYLLIPKYFAIGAAIASVCAEFLVLFIEMIYLLKKISFKSVYKAFVFSLFNSLVMSIPVLLCILFIKSIVMQLVFCILTGVLSYTLILIVEKNEFVLELISVIKKKQLYKFNKK